MSARVRVAAFGVGIAGLLAVVLVAEGGLPGFGRYPGPYGDVLNAVSVAQRHATDVVTAVNFDYRGFDTLGEEYILFTAATGLAVVLRALRDEEELPPRAEAAAARRRARRDDAVRLAAVLSVPLVVTAGWNITSHGQVNPGGGFQGGVLLATAVVVLFLGGEVLTARRVDPPALLDALEAAGAAGFAVIGLAAMLTGAAFLADVVPLGAQAGTVDSSGTIALISFAVGVEVAASVLVVIGELAEQTLLVRAP